MVIGVVAMLVLAVSVMASVSIGHGVYEKIKLQDAADAQAYSLAVKEARAYNFLAYTNRAMIVHYSAMLTVMSFVSHAVYLEQTVGGAASQLRVIPGLGAIFAGVAAAIKAWRRTVDAFASILIPVLTQLNIALWIAQEAMLYGTLLDLLTRADADGVLKRTDPKAQPGFAMNSGHPYPTNLAQAANEGVDHSNLKNFLHIMDDGPKSSDPSFDLTDPTGLRMRARLLRDNALSDPDMAKYRLLMGNLANSVRREWTAVGTGPLLIGRKWDFEMCLLIGQLRIEKTADSQLKSFSESFEGNRKDQLFASDDIKIEVRPGCSGLFDYKTVFELRFRATADARGGFHQENGGRKTTRHHEWRGITPFLTSDTSFVRPSQNHFGYPCNVILLSKDMGARPTPTDGDTSKKAKVFQMGNLSRNAFMAGHGTGKWDDSQEEVGGGFLDMTWKNVGGIYMDNGSVDGDASDFRAKTKGMMAMAVGRAIYHRPGDWKEEPNFFNPLWTARLAPVKTHWEKEALSQMVPEWEFSQHWFGDALNY